MNWAPFDFEAKIVAALQLGDLERYVLAGSAWPHLCHAFETQAMTREGLDAVLRLIVALDRTLESPSAADAVRTLVRRSPDAITLLEARSRSRGIDRLRAHCSREGRQTDLRAPSFDGFVGVDAIPLKRLIDPFAQDAKRARAAQRPGGRPS